MSFAKKFYVPSGKKLDLSKTKTLEKGPFKTKEELKAATEKSRKQLIELQELLYAEGKRSVLVVLQGLDAAGKDGTIRHVMAGTNPQGVKVASFKAPTATERAHDFLWRIHPHTPAHGEIAIFNRSHYEDVLVVRVHDLVPKKIWTERYDAIREFEEALAENGTTILKFYLHISPEEQLRRFEERLNLPAKNWKISDTDYVERKFWNKYIAAFEDALTKTSNPNAPWHVIPSDDKHFRNYAVSKIIADTMAAMNPKAPKPSVDIEKIRQQYHEAKTAASKGKVV